MDEDEIKIAVTRFGRVEGPTAASQPGTGLGLTLAIDLTGLHGGRVTIDSKKGDGTTITVSLPVERDLTMVRKRRKITG